MTDNKLSLWDRMEASRKANAKIQDRVNEAYRRHGDLFTLTDMVRCIATAHHAEYPQYDGHWDGWTLLIVERRVETWMGVAFERGDVTIAIPNTDNDCWTGYSIRNGCDTELPVGSDVNPY